MIQLCKLLCTRQLTVVMIDHFSSCAAAATPIVGVFRCRAAKKQVNVGKAGASAGLDDYIYDAPEEDDFDFM